MDLTKIPKEKISEDDCLCKNCLVDLSKKFKNLELE